MPRKTKKRPPRPKAPEPFVKYRRGPEANSWIRRAQLPPDHPDYCPILREKYLACKDKQNAGRSKAKSGVPWGWRRGDWDFHWAQKIAKGRETVEHMKKTGVIEAPDGVSPEDASKAEEALAYCVAVVREVALPARERLAAAKTLLEYTKAKPTQKSAVTVKTAEDWLAGVADEAGI